MRVEQVKKSYGKKEILKSVSFYGEPGDCVGIIGANGCGKSTLLAVLSGVLRADGGRFCYEGKSLLDNPAARSSIVGYVPQSCPLIEELTAKDNLRLWYSKQDMQKSLSDGVLSMLGIDSFIKTPVCKMSGGMQKRLAIGCSMASDPKVLLLDEPGAALDIVCKENIARYLEKYRADGGIVVIATHDTGELNMCNRLYILKNGYLTPYEYDGNIRRLAGSL